MEQGNVFRHNQTQEEKPADLSQSLWNRAMSFDFTSRGTLTDFRGFNPFGTGQCLSTTFQLSKRGAKAGFNPFGTGQCLST